MIVCIAVIGRKNEPLFLKTYTDAEGEDEDDANLRLHNIVHSSLDVVGERRGRKGQSGAADASTDMFLGHLCPIDEFRVYGYMTSTRLKLLAVLEDVNDIRESELKRVSIVCLTSIANNQNMDRALCRERVSNPVRGVMRSVIDLVREGVEYLWKHTLSLKKEWR